MKKILIIDDEVNIRESTKYFLDEKGYNVLLAENGQQGIELAMRHQPDIIICDVMMPQFDGYAVLENLRSYAATSAIPFLFLSAKAEKKEVSHSIHLGADEYIIKPFKFSELEQAVEKLLRTQVR